MARNNKKIENDLSDNLHTGLTNRFVDSTSKYFINSSNNKIKPELAYNTGKVFIINKIEYGSFEGFDLKFNKDVISHSLFSITHVKKSARIMIEEKINNFLNAPNDSINFGNISEINFKDNIKIFWGEDPIGQIIKGSSISSPIAESLNSEYIDTEKKLLISAKLQNWIDDLIKTKLWPLKENVNEKSSSNVRAIQFNVFENLGTMSVENFSTFLKNISPEDKSMLSKLGIRIGAKYFFVPNFLKKSSMELSALLWCAFNNFKFDGILPLPKDGRVSFLSDLEMKPDYWSAIGYLKLNNFAIRIDVFERIFFIARQKIKIGPFLDSSDLMNPIGCNSDQLRDIMKFCGFSVLKLPNERNLYFFEPKKVSLKIQKAKTKKIHLSKKSKNKKIITKNKKTADPDSPFAVLEKLL